jgi:hypothetical protein
MLRLQRILPLISAGFRYREESRESLAGTVSFPAPLIASPPSNQLTLIR